jgi:hypothetical protein
LQASVVRLSDAYEVAEHADEESDEGGESSSDDASDHSKESNKEEGKEDEHGDSMLVSEEGGEVLKLQATGDESVSMFPTKCVPHFFTQVFSELVHNPSRHC